MNKKFEVIVIDQDGKTVPGFPTAVPVDTYNYAIGFLNPHYAEWNDEFDREYPGLDGFSVVYNDFIVKKVNEVLGKVEGWPWKYWRAKAATLPGEDYFDIVVYRTSSPDRYFAHRLKEV